MCLLVGPRGLWQGEGFPHSCHPASWHLWPSGSTAGSYPSGHGSQGQDEVHHWVSCRGLTNDSVSWCQFTNRNRINNWLSMLPKSTFWCNTHSAALVIHQPSVKATTVTQTCQNFRANSSNLSSLTVADLSGQSTLIKLIFPIISKYLCFHTVVQNIQKCYHVYILNLFTHFVVSSAHRLLHDKIILIHVFFCFVLLYFIFNALSLLSSVMGPIWWISPLWRM